MPPIKIDDKIPFIDLFEDSPVNKINTGEFTLNKRVIIFGVPGAFTSSCSKTHLSGYASSADNLKSEQKVDNHVCHCQ